VKNSGVFHLIEGIGAGNEIASQADQVGLPGEPILDRLLDQ